MTYRVIGDAVLNFLLFFSLRVHAVSENEFYRMMTQNKSFVRWGDGEVCLMGGTGIRYQEYSKSLADELRSVLLRPESEIIVGVPYRFASMSLFELFRRKRLRLWVKSRAFFIRNCLFSKIRYADAFGFRLESQFCYLNALKMIASCRANIIIVAKRDANVARLCQVLGCEGRAEHLVVPERNAYARVDDIETKIMGYGKGDLILLSCGPAAKVLIGRCLNSGAQFVDIGHLIDQVS